MYACVDNDKNNYLSHLGSLFIEKDMRNQFYLLFCMYKDIDLI
jgi:hypothetical protein